MAFELHPRLKAGTYEVGMMENCHLLLKDQSKFPWFILVPEVAEGIEDLHQLTNEQYERVMRCIRKVSRYMENQFGLEKLNVACIGNQVRQMHIHIVARHSGDAAWPGVVWAYEGKSPYLPEDAARICEDAKVLLDRSSGEDLVSKLDRKVKISQFSLYPLEFE